MDDKEYIALIHVQEIKIRGMYVNMAVDVDHTLGLLIAVIYKYDQDAIKSLVLEKNITGIPLHKLTMFQKIDALKQGLIKYHPEISNTYKSDIELLDKLRGYRNLFAHQKISFKDIDTINFKRLVSDFRQETSIDFSYGILWKDLIAYSQTVINTLNILSSLTSNDQH
jgi:hypothetical protein